MPTYLTSRQWGAQKAALTRASKRGPAAVYQTVENILLQWEADNVCYPDDWHHLNRVLSDAFPFPQHVTVDTIHDALIRTGAL